jgi:hypothetical protein
MPLLPIRLARMEAQIAELVRRADFLPPGPIRLIRMVRKILL